MALAATGEGHGSGWVGCVTDGGVIEFGRDAKPRSRFKPTQGTIAAVGAPARLC